MFQKRRLLPILTTFFLAGVCVLLFFILLNGAANRAGLRKLYWLQADTSGIQGAGHSVSRWTYYRLCGVLNGRNSDCSKAHAGYPISPKDNFGSSSGIPSSFNSSRRTYFYLSKFSYAFYLIALFFGVLALLASLIALCGGTILGTFSLLFILATLFFTIISSALITALVVKAKHAFQNSGHSASIGTKLMAFTWTSVFLLLLSLILAFLYVCLSATRKRRHNRNVNDNDSSSYATDEKTAQRESSFRRPKYGPNRHSRPLTTMRDEPAAFNSPRLNGQYGAASGAGPIYPNDQKNIKRDSAFDQLNSGPDYSQTNRGYTNPNAPVAGETQPRPTSQSRPYSTDDDVMLSNNQHASLVTPRTIVRRPMFVSPKERDNYIANKLAE